MCVAIALTFSELPLTLIDAHALADRVHERGGEREVRFYYRARPALLPVWWCGRLHVLQWGNKDRRERKLPPTGWTWHDTLAEGRWRELAPEPVLIPVTYGYMGGVWFKIKEGLHGIVVRDRGGEPAVFAVCEPATRCYSVMTRCEWMPRLVGEVI